MGTFVIYTCMNDKTDGRLSQKEKDDVRKSLDELSRELEFLGLEFTSKGITRFIETLKNATSDSVKQFLEELDNRIDDELDSISFFFQKSSKLKFYDHPAAFGELVHQKFPSAEYDIREAANCFALDRYTATVMHSMRVLEVGLDALGHAVKVKRSPRGWGTDLNIFSTAWEKHLKAKPKTRGWKRSFFPQLFLEFRYFAAAWRNQAFHNSKVWYGEEEAERVFDHVKNFMELLATKLSERKRQI
jgi:HEPN domain-containing protein